MNLREHDANFASRVLDFSAATGAAKRVFLRPLQADARACLSHPVPGPGTVTEPRTSF